jgi:hypothetical protein
MSDDDFIIYFPDMDWVTDPTSLEDQDEEDPELDEESDAFARAAEEQCGRNAEQSELTVDLMVDPARRVARFAPDDPRRLPD